MDFAINPTTRELAARVRLFVETHCIPREAGGFDSDGISEATRLELSALAKEAGLFAPRMPTRFGGLGLDLRDSALVFEEAGRSLLGPVAINCNAPDDGNAQLLAAVGTERQLESHLGPLVRGELRSCFAMTEPAPGAGSDPGMLKTSAVRIEGGWRIDGRKWFTTGAIGASFAIVMARTAAGERGGGATMFLVDLDNPGVQIVRSIRTTDSTGVGGHCEVAFEGCRVGDDDVLGEVNAGFRYAQVRLAPARLTHCMRWLGLARRAHEATVEHVAVREVFGARLAEHGMAQAMLADNDLDLEAGRLLTWKGCAEIDAGEKARSSSSRAKLFVSEAVFRVIDRCVQLHGAAGISEDTGLSRLLSEARGFRIYDGPSEVHRMSLGRRLVQQQVVNSGSLATDR